MEKLENLRDSKKYELVVEEIERFKRLIHGHRKLLAAIGNL